jgi:hypothetical protein
MPIRPAADSAGAPTFDPPDGSREPRVGRGANCKEVLQFCKRRRKRSREELGRNVSGREIEQLVDKAILLANIIVAEPPSLALADHGHGLVTRNRSRRCAELMQALLGLHSSFNRAMILLPDVVQVLHRSMSAAAAQGSFRFYRCNRREASSSSVNDPGLRMRWIAERLAEQTFGRSGSAQRRQQKVDGGSSGIEGPVEETPTDLHSKCTSRRHARICWSA